MANVDDPTIPVSCADAPIPVALQADDCFVAELNYGPIVNLYLARAGQPFAAAPTLTEIERRLALPDTDDEQLIGPVVVQVSRTPPTDNAVRVNGVDYTQNTVSSFDFTVQHITDAIYEFFRTTQKGGRKVIAYGVDQNSKWWGGQNGLTGGASTIKGRINIPTDETGLQTITGTISGLGAFDPKRIPSPVAPVFG